MIRSRIFNCSFLIRPQSNHVANVSYCLVNRDRSGNHPRHKKFSFGTDASFHEVADKSLEEIETALEVLDDLGVDSDISLSQGVLKLTVGTSFTWVINKQTPNRQLWWSSPISGPRRYEMPPTPTNASNKITSSDVDANDYNDGVQLVSRWHCTKAGVPNIAESLRQEIFQVAKVDILLTQSKSASPMT